MVSRPGGMVSQSQTVKGGIEFAESYDILIFGEIVQEFNAMTFINLERLDDFMQA
jgi:hypothetical protein